MNTYTRYYGDSDVGDFMMVTDFRCWWQNHYVGDFFHYLGDFLNVLNRSTTSQTCHQHSWSPTSVTNIDETLNTSLQTRMLHRVRGNPAQTS